VIERPCGWEWPSAGILLLLLSLKESILVTAIHNRHIINNTFVIYVITVSYRITVHVYIRTVQYCIIRILYRVLYTVVRCTYHNTVYPAGTDVLLLYHTGIKNWRKVVSYILTRSESFTTHPA
jgi:hypothetical protein